MRSYFFILFLSLLSINLWSQAQPVKWSFQAEKTGEQEYNISFTAEAEPGWYLYSQHLDEGGPIPTSFEFEKNDAISFLGEIEESGNKKEGFDQLFAMKVVSYSGTTRFTQKIKTTNESAVIKGFLTFMTCNGKACLPPTDVDFNIPLN